MKNKILLLITALTLISLVLLTACGKGTDGSDQKTVETTLILETTADGGTVEQDPDGNVVTKDKNSKVTNVVDAQGNTVDVSDYLETHPWVENSGTSVSGSNNAGGNAANGNNSGSNNSGNNNSGNNGGSGSSGGNGNSGGNDNGGVQSTATEGEIPAVVATTADPKDAKEFPDM